MCDMNATIIMNKCIVKKADGFESRSGYMNDVADALSEIRDVLIKYSIASIEGKGITFEDGALKLIDSSITLGDIGLVKVNLIADDMSQLNRKVNQEIIKQSQEGKSLVNMDIKNIVDVDFCMVELHFADNDINTKEI